MMRGNLAALWGSGTTEVQHALDAEGASDAGQANEDLVALNIAVDPMEE